MDSQDQQVLAQLQHWLDEGGNHWLCTVVATFGSSPRPVGSLLAVNADGRFAGSLSGGCVEEDLIERFLAGEIACELPEFTDYGVSAEQSERLGLPCGGHLKVLLEKLGPQHSEKLARIVQALEQRRCIQRVLDMESGDFELHRCQRVSPLHIGERYLQQTYGPRFLMLLVGAGQLAASLAAFALAMDYRVMVCDPREELLEAWPIAGAELLCQMPDDAVREYASDSHSVVITLSHDPRIDDMALMEALGSEAFYVGALGSKKTSEGRLERLRKLGINEEQLQRLHAPVGLAIASKTPPEIAVSILAQLTQLRARYKQAPGMSVA